MCWSSNFFSSDIFFLTLFRSCLASTFSCSLTYHVKPRIYHVILVFFPTTSLAVIYFSFSPLSVDARELPRKKMSLILRRICKKLHVLSPSLTSSLGLSLRRCGGEGRREAKVAILLPVTLDDIRRVF